MSYDIDLEEELERIKREFDNKFGASGMSFDELPDDLESMLNSYSVGSGAYNTNSFQDERPSYSQQQYQQPQQTRQSYQPQPQQQQQTRQSYQQQPQQQQNRGYNQNQNQIQNQRLKQQQEEEEKYMLQEQLDIELDRYLDEGYQEEIINDEFDDALPPLEDMLLLVTSPKIHEAYNYVLPKRQYAMPSTTTPSSNNSYSSQSQQQYSKQPQQQQQSSNSFVLPDLEQVAWSVVDCDTIVQHLKKLLMAVLQDALVVKKLDLTDSSNTAKAESVFKSAGNALKEARTIITVIGKIDTQDSNHLAIQEDVGLLADTMIKSTVVMLRTAMNVTKRAATIDQFNNVYAPFFKDAKDLIGMVNNLAFDTWGPNEVFFS